LVQEHKQMFPPTQQNNLNTLHWTGSHGSSCNRQLNVE
jgi:hypothetical protein